MPTVQSNIGQCQADGDDKLFGPGEQLKNGIWPQSVPLWMAAFYIALFIIRPWEKLFPWLGIIHFERLYAIYMIALIFLYESKNFEMNGQTLSVLFFVGALAISGFLAIDPSLSRKNLYEYITLVIFYFIILLVIHSQYDLVFIVISYIVSMAVYLAKAQWEYFVHGAHRYDMGVIRMVGIEGTFGGPNSLAMSIVVSLPMLLFLWSIHKELTSSWPNFWRKWFPRFLKIYLALAISSIILTNSRSGMVSFVVFIIFVALKGKGGERKVIYLLVGMLLLALLWQVIPEEKKGRLRTIWAPETGPNNAQVSAQGRVEGFKTGIEMFTRFPITGVGIGNFINYRMIYGDGVELNAHNLFGQVLGETGLLGTTFFVLLLFITLTNCNRARILSKDSSDIKLKTLYNLAGACRDALLLLIFTGLFGHNLRRFNWLWLAAFSTLTIRFTTQFKKNQSKI